MINRQHANILICGAGIVGLTIARELIAKGFKNIVILEKENEIGQHASGKNSGVLHAGVYYAPDTLKAQFCLKGNLLLKEYCHDKKIELLNTGKVIVTQNQEEIPVLLELYERAKKNGAKVQLMDEKELNQIEPYAKTYKKAIYSYYTAVVDPQKILNALYNDLIATKKVKILTNHTFIDKKSNNQIITNHGPITFDLFINAAGAYSDKVAHTFDVGLQYYLVPFKGLYKKLKRDKSYLVNGNIYPVPNIANPFLGIHLTKNIQGDIYIGPTAIPALGRENYHLFDDLQWESFKFLYQDMILLLRNSLFRKTAFNELKNYNVSYIFEHIQNMMCDVNLSDIKASNKVGIRPQLVDWTNKKLVMDFLTIKQENGIHILNAISPAFTSSMAFAEYIVKKYT